MGTFVLFGLCTCLLIGSGMTVNNTVSGENTDSCSLNQFLMCAQHVGNVETPQNMTGVCEDLQKAYSCVEDLWKSCGYDCSAQLKAQANAGQKCGLYDKKNFDTMNKAADPCTVMAEIKKCKEDNCPAKVTPVDPRACTIKNHFRCAAVIDKMEDRSVMENKGTCPVLKEAITCIENLWSGCGYDCTKTYEDIIITNDNHTCFVHDEEYTDTIAGNLEIDEHPCVVLQNLKGCLPNCPDGASQSGSSTDPVRRLDQLELDNNKITTIRAKRECVHKLIDERLKEYDSDETNYPNSQTCDYKQIVTSLNNYKRDLIGDEGTPKCSGSAVQMMVVDVIGHGAQHYVKQCGERKCSELIMFYYEINYNATSNYQDGKLLDCDGCGHTTDSIKENKEYTEQLSPTTCPGTKIQRVTMDIMKVGTQHAVNYCDTKVKCGASSLSNPLVAICLLVIAYVFSV